MGRKAHIVQHYFEKVQGTKKVKCKFCEDIMAYKPETQMRHLTLCSKCAEIDVHVQRAAELWLDEVVQQRQKREEERRQRAERDFEKYARHGFYVYFFRCFGFA